MEYASWDMQRNAEGKLTMAVVRSASDQPWEVWCSQQQVGQNATAIALQQVSAHAKPLAGISFGKQEPFYWTASDGLALDGILIRPVEDRETNPLPMVLLVHGDLTADGGTNSTWMHSTGDSG